MESTQQMIGRSLRRKYKVHKADENRELKRGLLLAAGYAAYLCTMPLWFWLADMERGYDATGGEALLAALPLLIWWLRDTWREWQGK